MNTNELILSTTNAPSKFTFKNAKLNEISTKIAAEAANMNSVYNAAKEGAEAVNKALAPLFGELLKTKCYKDDGFKSVADYAETTFGMSKAMAYMLARVGDKFYSDNSEEVVKVRETLSTSKLAELTGTDRVALAKAIDAGELSSETSLATCRDFATAHKKPGKERVLSTFTVVDMCKTGIFCENVTKEDMYEQVAAAIVANYPEHADSKDAVFFSSAKLEGDKASNNQHFIAYTATGFTRMYEYRPYVKKSVKSAGKRPTFAELLKSLSAEEIDQLRSYVERGEEVEGGEE